MNRVTVILTYYDNANMLVRQLADFRKLPREVALWVRLIIVDDASPRRPLIPALAALAPERMPFEIYRMREDIRWNQDACRNLAAGQAVTPWLLMTDIDHRIPEGTLRAVIEDRLDPEVVYRFSRVSEPDLAPYKPHPNSWLMSSMMFKRIGGYDERLAGYYGTDGDFAVRAAAASREIVVRDEALIRVPREVTEDASTTTLTRKSPEDKEAIRRLLRDRKARNEGPVTGRFEWDRIV